MKTLIVFAFGAGFIAWGIHGAATGSIWVPLRKGFFSLGSEMSWIHRTEAPARFWAAVGLLWILGGVLIAQALSLAMTGTSILNPRH